MNSTPSSCYCHYCDWTWTNGGVWNDPDTHNFKENGKIVCRYYISKTASKISKTTVKSKPVAKPTPVPVPVPKSVAPLIAQIVKLEPVALLVPVIAELVKLEPVAKPALKNFDLHNRCSDSIAILRIEIDERQKEADLRASRKFAEMSESEKVRIANWMRSNIPLEKSVGKEWQPYLSQTVPKK